MILTGLALTLVAAVAIAWFAFPLPIDILHPGEGGGLVMDSEGGPILDVVADDGQRRLHLQIEDSGPWIGNAIVATEDLSFRSHVGVDPLAILGAMRDNVIAGRVVRGASTITMQVAGLKMGHPRTIPGKTVEAFRALQIEQRYEKDDILEAWMNLASFGGNLVGAETASRAWFGKSLAECSLPEAALLAGLPNSPERFRPDRHPEAARGRRDLVLDRMLNARMIDETQHRHAVMSPIVLQNERETENLRHAGWMALRSAGRGRAVETTIDPTAQSILERIVADHAAILPRDLDIAVVLVETATGEVRGLIGSSDPLDPRDGQVNGTTARRSPGSALKPFIYAAAFEAGRLAPDSIVDDVPIDISGWRPRNIDRGHRGPMPAGEALRTSRNVPAILITRDLGLDTVEATLRRSGLPLPIGALSAAGLTAAVGGVEVRAIDLAEAYATLARGGIHRSVRLLRGAPSPTRRVFSESTCAAIEACLAGPESDVSAAMPFVAAKTGTSSGQRDAVAAGWNRRWTAVVWVGRFDGGRNPSLIGATAALPVLREILLDPAFATSRSPRDFEPWDVVHAVGRVGPPRVPAIIEPRDGDRLIFDDGPCLFRPQFRIGTAAHVFLDGAPIDHTEPSFAISPGAHELRIVEAGKPPHAVRFEVVRPR
jgi:penicillin-binding protein 1C